jgi:hypothetical protein
MGATMPMRHSRARGLERLAVSDLILDGQDEVTLLPLFKHALVDGRGLPALRHLELLVGRQGLVPTAFDWLWTTPLGAQLEMLTLRPWHDELPSLVPWEKANVVSRSLRAVQMVTRDRGVMLTRGGDGRLRSA